jgi:hypothetical protein
MKVLEFLLLSRLSLNSIRDGHVDEYGGASLAGLSGYASLIPSRYLQVDTSSV